MWEILEKTSDVFWKTWEIFWIISDVFFVSWEKISCLMGEIFCSMRAKFLVDDNELLVKSNNIEEIFGEFWGWKLWFLCSQMGGKVETEWRRENHNIMRGKNGALARARTRTPCNFALFAFTTFTKMRVRGSKWGVYEGNRNGVRESVVFECWKERKKADFERKEGTLEIAVFEVVLGRYCEGCESKKVEIPVTYARVGLKPQSVVRPQ